LLKSGFATGASFGDALTETQANVLLKERWIKDEKELAVKRAYTAKFKTVLSAKKTFLCFDLLNDKRSKIEGRDTSSEE